MNALRNERPNETNLFLNTPVITTERLMLRAPHFDDAEDLAVIANNINVARMLGNMPHPYSRNDAISFIERYANMEGHACVYAVTEAESGQIMGVCGLHEDRSRYELPYLGYWIGEPFWGKGFATESARAMVDLFFKVTSSPELMVSARADNEASKKIIGKIGGQYRSKSLVHNQILDEEHDLEHYHITRQSWIDKISA